MARIAMNSQTRRSFLATSIGAGCAILGCREKEKLEQPISKKRVLALRLGVVDDRPMAGAISRLRTEWKGLTGGTFEIAELPAGRLESDELLDVDAVIIPPAELSMLAERGRLVPIEPETLDDKLLDWRDIFELVRVGEASWGTKVYGIPFGSPILALYYNAPLLAAHGRQPPNTWQEYHELADFFSGQGKPRHDAAAADWSPVCEPLKSGWAGRVLLARAADYAKHPENYSTLFDITSMRPLIDGPPFVRALEELVKANRAAGARNAQLDAKPAIELVTNGTCAMAIGCNVGAATESSRTSSTGKPDVAVAELPGARDVFDYSHKAWTTHAADAVVRATLLGLAGRLGVVLENSSYPDDALRLLIWLSSARWGTRISAASGDTAPYRHSQTESPDAWLRSPAINGPSYARAVEQSLSRTNWLSLRVPGYREYWSALDEAVQSCVLKAVPPATALSTAAEKWSAITKCLGAELQARAYRRSVGLEE